MILRPLEPEATDPSKSDPFVPAWQVVERLQKRRYESCWMITQPSHAALAGQLAAKLTSQAGHPRLPQLSPDLIRAIAMHDAGWGMPDAQAVAQSRSSHHTPPRSFLQTSAAEFVDAWTQSIQIVQSISPAGGYIVSRHFWRLAEHRVATPGDTEADRGRIGHFLEKETLRQRKLAAKQARGEPELEALTDLLQFCDLLSLYICCGAQEHVEFPEYFGTKMQLTVAEGAYRLEPLLIAPGTRFAVAALRHPATKEVSGREIEIEIG
jgi:hypothetical protein